MTAAVMYLFCFFQMPTANGPIPDHHWHESIPDPHWPERLELEQLSEEADSTVAAEAARREAAYEDQQFVNKFNNLAHMMMDFASHYNSRHTIDVKGVEKLRRALTDLEKSDAWFRAEHDRGVHKRSTSDQTPKKH